MSSRTQDEMKHSIQGTKGRLTRRVLALYQEVEQALGNVRNGGSHAPTFAQMGAEVDRLIAEHDAKLEMFGLAMMHDDGETQ